MNAAGHFDDGIHPKSPANDFLARFDGDIQRMVRSRIRQYGVPLSEIDDVYQEVRIKLWSAYNQLTIEKPRAYISTTVKSVLIDTKRKHKPTQALPTNEDGELYQGNLLIKQCQEVQDPADIIVQKEALTESVTLAFNAIQTLPPRQRHATLCVLKDQLDDLHDLTAVAIRDIDIESICWPDERYEKQLLRASLAISRKKLHMLLSDRLSDH